MRLATSHHDESPELTTVADSESDSEEETSELEKHIPKRYPRSRSQTADAAPQPGTVEDESPTEFSSNDVLLGGDYCTYVPGKMRCKFGHQHPSTTFAEQGSIYRLHNPDSNLDPRLQELSPRDVRKDRIKHYSP